MASGFDARVAIVPEVTYGTRVAPTRFLPLLAEDFGFTPNREFSDVIGTGAWSRPSVVTTKAGTGSISGHVMDTGFGYLLNFLNGNTNTPVQQAATTAYLTTFNMDSAPNKSATVQVQNPPVTSATLVPHDMTGVVFGGLTLSWGAGGLLAFEMPVVYQNLDTSQSNVSYSAPPAYNLFSFQHGSVTIGGVAQGRIVGDGSVSMNWALRDDAFYLGSSGLMAQPVPNAKPTAELAYTADFVDNTELNRTLNNTQADVVVKFESSTIASTYKYMIEVTLPDCVFTTNRATISGPGLLQQSVTATVASSTGDYPIVKYQSTGATL
jgi:hypothetical protein